MSQPRRETNLRSFGPPETRVELRPTGPESLSVSAVLERARSALWREAGDVWVRGDLSAFNAHPSGHWYFTLKDDRSVLRCVMWASKNARMRFRPEVGMEILVRGGFDVYAAKGEMQFSVLDVQPVGAGALQLAFEQLRAKLAAEGLFARPKRPLPMFPRAVGIVTSLQAAALRDMVRIATERHPGVRIVVANARVQGDGAAGEIAAGIARLNAQREVDVIIVGRGGGSIEDLWAFNEEPVVRAVAASRIPIVSAVGHETDTTLCDHAADVRAATPSNACEIVVAPTADEVHQRLDEGEERMAAALERLVPDLRLRLDALDARAASAARRGIQRERDRVAAQAARLHALSPLAVLDRGYSVVRKDGRSLRSVDGAEEGDDVTIVARDGELDATVKRKRRKSDGD